MGRMETCDDFVVVTDRRAVPGPAVGDQDRARAFLAPPTTGWSRTSSALAVRLVGRARRSGRR
ncbi:hypothetical protein I546_0603 [Mycobacterium kansasii 732]|nr:hypothetical protein I546_0603 [Mycobacterium kansasii 732]